MVLFLILAILQIVSLSTSWMYFSGVRTDPNNNVETLTLRWYLGGLSISHQYNPSTQGNMVSVYQYCDYESKNTVPPQNSILNFTNTTSCPTMTNTPQLFHSTVTSTGILTIICDILMIIWLGYRSTLNGIKRLFRSQCCTMSVSLLLSVLVIGFSAPGFSLIVDQFNNAVVKDFGKIFWSSWGCSTSYYSSSYFSCYSSSCNPLPYGYYCNSAINNDTGMVIAYVNLAFYVIFSVYTWIGSWCCSCCCPGVDEEVFPTTTTSIHYTNAMTATVPQTSGEYTLYVHHGAQFPTKVVVRAATIEQLHHGIMETLGLSLPFRVAVFDEICQQYVLVTSLQLIPPQATVQLLFN